MGDVKVGLVAQGDATSALHTDVEGDVAVYEVKRAGISHDNGGVLSRDVGDGDVGEPCLSLVRNVQPGLEGCAL